MWQRMINKLNYGKRHIMDLVEQATNAFDQREELCTKLQILKDRGLNDKSNHVQEMRELQRKLDHDAKLQEFLAIKGQQRLNTEQQERDADKRKKRLEEMERQCNEYDKIFQRIAVSSFIRFSMTLEASSFVSASVRREGNRENHLEVRQRGRGELRSVQLR